MRSLRWCGLFLTLFLLPGCILKPSGSVKDDKDKNPPKMIDKVPSAAELVSYLNKTEMPNQKITAFTADSVWIDAKADKSKAPTVRGYLVCEKPRNFRLVGKVVGVDQVDFGSNSERFWFWIKESPEPNIFHCSYDDFDKGTPLPFPFQPEWVVQVLGMAEYGDPANYKVTEKDKTFELSEETTLQGKPVKKVIVFSKFLTEVPKSQIQEFKVIDANGKTLCSARIDRAARDARTGIVYPDVVVMEWPEEKLTMKLELGSVKINQPSNEKQAAKYFRLPDYTKQIDLGRLNSRTSPSSRIQPVGSYSNSRN